MTAWCTVENTTSPLVSPNEEEPRGAYVRLLLVSEVGPDAAAPVAAAFMLAPAVFVAWAPGPVVSMDDHAGRRRIVVDRCRVPAIAIAVADDACRGGCCRQGQGARSDERADRDLAQCFHTGLVL